MPMPPVKPAPLDRLDTQPGTGSGGQAPPLAPAQLYRKVLGSPNDAALLEELRRRAQEVLDARQEEEFEQALETEPVEGVPAEWLAKVYQALGEAQPLPELSGDVRQALLKENQSEEEEIGRALKKALLRGLTPPLANLVVVFAAVPRISPREQRNLRQTISVGAAWPECAGLVACGLTPLGVFYATKAVFPLARRLQECGTLPPSPSVVLSGVQASSAPTAVAPQLAPYAVREIIGVARCTRQAAETLLNWLIDVAGQKPLVFGGARARQQHKGVVELTADHEYSNKSLHDRWAERAAGASAAPTIGPVVATSSRPG
jgi:hypothetical protein